MTLAIVHVASGREWRGGQRQVWLLARELARREIDQVVVTRRDSELARRLDSAGVRVRGVGWGAGLDPRVIPALLGELHHPNTILHAHDAHALTLAGVCAVLRPAPLVATRRVVFPLRHKLFWARADRVIAISDAVRERLTRDGLSPERLAVIPSAVDLAELRAPGLDVRTRFGLPERGQVAVTLGALTPEKDQATLVEAAALLVRDLPELHWVIVGEGPLRSSLQHRVARHGLEERVHLVGPLSDPHVALTGADVFVLSSVSEGLGSAVLAAMARGLPVVSTRVGGVPELLRSGSGVLVPAGSPFEFAAAVRRVLCEPGYSDGLKHAARQELGRFSADAMADQVMKVYRSCAHSLEGS